MFSLALVKDKLQLIKKRSGIYVVKSSILGIHQNDEIVEINHIEADNINEATLNSQLSEPNIILVVLPNDKNQLIQCCLKANKIYVEKSNKTMLTKILYSTDDLIKVKNKLFI